MTKVTPPAEKACSKCGEVRAIDMFKPVKGCRDGHQNQCRLCDREYRRRHYQANKARYREHPSAVAQRESRAQAARRRKAKPRPHVKDDRFRKYGVLVHEFNTMLAAQDGRCLICTEVMPVPQLDHDHKSGKVRALLCRGCNYGLGYFRDNPARLLAAIDYLNYY